MIFNLVVHKIILVSVNLSLKVEHFKVTKLLAVPNLPPKAQLGEPGAMLGQSTLAPPTHYNKSLGISVLILLPELLH
jgi:hypothetical protein